MGHLEPQYVLRASIKMFKILGGYDYRMQHGKASQLSYKNKVAITLYCFWRIFLYTLIAVGGILYIYHMPSRALLKLSKSSTARFTIALNDVAHLVTVLILENWIFYNGRLLVRVINELKDIKADASEMFNKDKSRIKKLSIVLLPLFTIGSGIQTLVKYHILAESTTFSDFLDATCFTVLYFLEVSYSMFLWAAMIISSMAIKRAIFRLEPLLNCFLKSNAALAQLKNIIDNPEMQSNYSKFMSSHDCIRFSDGHLQFLKQKFLTELRTASQCILSSHKTRFLFLDYCGVPIATLLLYMILNIILNAFNLSYVMHVPVMLSVMNITAIASALSFAGFLVIPPLKVKGYVSFYYVFTLQVGIQTSNYSHELTISTTILLDDLFCHFSGIIYQI